METNSIQLTSQLRSTRTRWELCLNLKLNGKRKMIKCGCGCGEANVCVCGVQVQMVILNGWLAKADGIRLDRVARLQSQSHTPQYSCIVYHKQNLLLRIEFAILTITCMLLGVGLSCWADSLNFLFWLKSSGQKISDRLVRWWAMIYWCLLLSPLLHIDSIESGTKFLYIIYWNIMDGGTNANCHFPINIFLFAPLSCLLSNIWVISSVNRSIIQRKSTTEPESEPYFSNTITSRTNITVRLKKETPLASHLICQPIHIQSIQIVNKNLLKFIYRSSIKCSLSSRHTGMNIVRWLVRFSSLQWQNIGQRAANIN